MTSNLKVSKTALFLIVFQLVGLSVGFPVCSAVDVDTQVLVISNHPHMLISDVTGLYRHILLPEINNYPSDLIQVE